MNTLRSTKSDFTLLELLIVIAIMGLLVTLLMPSLKKARLAAKTGVSMSNLKQIHIGTISYSTDHNGFLFLTHENPTPIHAQAKWRVPVYSYIGGEELPVTDTRAYMRDSTYRQIMYCPVLVDDRGGYPDAKESGRGHYGMNKYFGDEPLTAPNTGKGYKSVQFASLTNDKEPLYMATKAMTSTSSGFFLGGGEMQATDRGTPEYLYTNGRSLASYLEGGVSLKSASWGASVHTLLSSHHDFD